MQRQYTGATINAFAKKGSAVCGKNREFYLDSYIGAASSRRFFTGATLYTLHQYLKRLKGTVLAHFLQRKRCEKIATLPLLIQTPLLVGLYPTQRKRK